MRGILKFRWLELGVLAGVVFSAPSAGFVYAQDPTGSSGQSGTSGQAEPPGQPGAGTSGQAAAIPGETARAAAAAAAKWRIELVAGGGYDDNVLFVPTAKSDVSGRARARLTRWIRGPRGTMSLSAYGDGTRYQEFHQYDAINYGSDVSGTYRSSPRTAFTLVDTFSKSFTGDANLLVASGLLLPRTVVRSNVASVEAAHRISPQWTWNALTRHQLVLFDSNAGRDGSTLYARAAIDRRGARDTLNIAYEFGHNRTSGQPSDDVHGPNVRVDRRFANSVGVWLDAGARWLRSAAGTTGRPVFVGATGLAFRSTRQLIEAQVSRSVSQAYGLGRQQQRSAVSLRFVRTLTSFVTFDLLGDLGRSVDPGGNPNLGFDTRNLTADLGFRLAKDVRLLAGGGYRSNDPFTAPRVESRFATLALRVGQNW